MGEKFIGEQWLVTEQCCNCGMLFAMSADYQKRRRDDHGSFYCPAGHGQHYTGKTEEQKLKEELERKNEMLDAANARANAAHDRAAHVSKAHRKMRQRVFNGVCPCCNRSFGNLREHMKTQHPDFAQEQTLRMLRDAFAMTQQDVAREAGVEAPYVSLYERGKPLPKRARERLEGWIESHAKEPQ